MSDKETTHPDYSTEEKVLEWSLYPNAIKSLTRQRDILAQALRHYEADAATQIDPRKLLQETRTRLHKELPEFSTDATSILDISVRDLIASYWDQVGRRKNTASTGLAGLDDALNGGFEPNRLVGLLGAPNCGKTTLANQIADHNACGGRPVVYVTSEDTPSVLFAKTLTRIGKAPYNAVLRGWERERDNIRAALALQAERLSSDRLRYIDATGGISLNDIREKAERHFAMYRDAENGGPGILFIDYLQRIARSILATMGGSRDLRHVVTEVTEWLRALAGELGCTVVAVASQSRNNYNRSDAGSLGSGKESGDIEYTLDVQLALVEDRDKNRAVPPGMIPVVLHIDKNRQGEKGAAILLDFSSSRQQFTVQGK